MSDFFKDIDLKSVIEADLSKKESQKREDSVGLETREPEPPSEAPGASESLHNPDGDAASESFLEPEVGANALRKEPELVVEPPARAEKAVALAVQASPPQAASPPPIPMAAPPAVAAPAMVPPAGTSAPPPAPPSPDGSGQLAAPPPDVIKQYMPAPVPREHDIGGLGKTLIWLFSTVIVGGGLAVWFIGFHLVETHLGAITGMLDMDQYEDSFQAMSGDSISAADEEDLQFISQQLGIPPEELGLDPSRSGSSKKYEYDIEELQGRTLRLQWPDVRLAGVIEGTETHPASVILDGVLTRIGGSVRGVKVLDVRDNGAVLEYQGEQQWLFSSQRTVRNSE